MTPSRLLFAALFALLAADSGARDWTSDPAQSTLGFRAEAQGEAFDGRFERFEPIIRFDPAQLDESRFDVRIDLSSVDTQNVERDQMLADPAFFDSATRPQARYVADTFTALGGDRYRADGVLTLNAIERPVPLEFRWITDGSGAVLDGSAVLDRLAFGVGSGDWSDPDTIGREVRVDTRLSLRAGAQ